MGRCKAIKHVRALLDVRRRHVRMPRPEPRMILDVALERSAGRIPIVPLDELKVTKEKEGEGRVCLVKYEGTSKFVYAGAVRSIGKDDLPTDSFGAKAVESGNGYEIKVKAIFPKICKGCGKGPLPVFGWKDRKNGSGRREDFVSREYHLKCWKKRGDAF